MTVIIVGFRRGTGLVAAAGGVHRLGVLSGRRWWLADTMGNASVPLGSTAAGRDRLLQPFSSSVGFYAEEEQNQEEDRMSKLMEADGYMGQRITFDGQTVTVVKRKKEVRFRAADVRAIQWKDARKWWNGEVKFVVPGASDAPQTGSYWTKTGKDEGHRYTITFLVEQSAAMRAVCDAIQRAGGNHLDQAKLTNEDQNDAH